MRVPATILAALVAACSSSPPEPLSVTRGAAALAEWRQGRLDAAETGYLLALEEDRFTVDVHGSIKHLNNLGVLALHDERVEEAVAYFERALELCEVHGTDDRRARLRLQLATCHLRVDALDRAAELLGELEDWSRTAADADRVQHGLSVASLRLRAGDRSGARDSARAALELADAPEDRATAALLVGKASDDVDAARTAFEAALEDARRAGQLPLVVESLLGLAATHAGTDPATGRRYCELAEEAAASRGYEVGVERARRALQRLEGRKKSR